MKKLLLITTALVAAAEPAHAGPIAAAVSWIGTTIAAGGVMGALVQMGVGFALNAVAGALMKPKAPGADVQFDVQMGDDQPLSFVLGDYATAGKRKYIGSWGRNTRFITEVIEYSALPQGLAGIWVNDERGEFVADTRGYVSASASPGDVRDQSEGASVPGGNHDIGQPLTNYSDDGNRIYVKVVPGAQSVADPFLVWAFGADPDYPWTADMVGIGKSYVIVTTRYDSDTLTGYPQYLIEPAPLALYDVRLDSTNGGSGAHRWNDPATWSPTSNAAIIAYNIVRGIRFGDEWVYGGKNLAAWRLPPAEWIAAANECDDAVSLAGGGTEPRYRAGLEVRCDVPPADVLDEIAKAANMRFAEVGGQLKPIAGLPASAAFSFTDDDIVITEGQSFKPFFAVTETYNAISATYPEPAEKWGSKDAREYVDEDATDEDGGRYLPTSMTYGAVPYRRQVRRLMRSQMRDYRRMRRHQISLPPEAYALEPGVDMVSWTSQRNGYSNKMFMVESVAKTPGMLVQVSLREVNPGDYDWSIDFEAPPTIIVPKNPVRFVQPISGLTVLPALIRDQGGTGRRPAIAVSCDGEEAGVTDIQIQARVLGQPVTIDTSRRFGGDFEWFLRDVLPLTAYEVRARLLSELTPKSVWSPWLSVTTLKAGYTEDDIADQVLDSMRDIAEAAGVTPVDVLPASGEPNQIVMKVPEGILYRWDAGAGAWTTQIYAGIQPGSLNVAAFAETIRPVEIVASLPGAPHQAGRIVFRTSDSKLFRNTGSGWTAAIPTSDLTGQITSTQITDGAVSTPKLAAGSVEADKIATNAVTADKVNANAITAGKIAAGAVSATEIAAGAIVASKMAITNFANLVADFDFLDPAYWASGTGAYGLVASTAPEGGGARMLRIDADSTNTVVTSGWIEIEPGNDYLASVYRSNSPSGGPDGILSVQTGAVDSAGAITSSRLITLAQGNGGGWSAMSGAFTATATENRARVRLIRTGDGTATAVRFAGPKLMKRAPAELIVDGAITADKIATGAVVADKIAASAIVASKLAAGAVTADKILSNTITSAEINVSQLVGSSAFLNNLSVGSAQIENLAVGRIKIADGAVTEFPFSFSAGDITLTPQGTWVNIQTVVFSRGRPDPLPLFVQVQLATLGGNIQYRIRRGTTVVWSSEPLSQALGEEFSHTYVDSTTSTGSVTYRLDARCVAPTSIGYLRNRFLGGLNAFK